MTLFPTFYTSRLHLRKLQADDIPSLVKYANNKNISRYILNIPHPYQEHDAVFRISYVHQGFVTKTRYVFALALQETNEFIGEISLHLDTPQNRAQLAYWVGEPHWNKGYATEAIQAVLRFGFEKLSLGLIFATCDVENTGSVKVLEKNHFKRSSSAGNILQYVIERIEYITAG